MNDNINSREVSSILLVGGTHGNELTGIHLVQHWQQKTFEQYYPSLNLDYLIANSEARTANKRYIEHDLNRCFKRADLENDSLTSIEQQRAKEINRQFGPKGDPKTDFIIDLHTSTANMQTNIVLTRIDPFHLHLAAYLKSVLDDVVITSETELMDDHHFLESLAHGGIVIEVGAIPQGSLEYPCYQKTELAVKATLDFLTQFNLDGFDSFNKLTESLEVMSYHSKLFFPTDSQGEVSSTVHPDLLGRAYPKIETGDPAFIDFDGNDELYDGETTYLAFINEAAYYDQKIAMCCCRPVSFSIKTGQLVT